MATIAKLAVELSMDDKGFSSGIDSARSKIDKFAETTRKWGAGLTAGVTLPLAAGATKFVQWAASAENAVGKTTQVFGDNADAVIAWAATTDRAFGIAESDALQMTSTYGALFNMMGQTTEQSAAMSQEMLGLSADMAAFNDVSQSRASEAIMAGLTGEYESLKRMGVFLNEAIVAEEALAIARKDGRDEITEADKVLARYNLILEQTNQQHGQFARESGSFNGKLAVLTARFKNLGATIGAKLIPPLIKGMDAFAKVFEIIESISPRMLTMVIVIAALAAAIGPLLLGVSFLASGLSILLGIVAALASPIGLIVVAVGALAYLFRDELGAAVEWIVEKFGELRDVFNEYLAISGDPMLSALGALQKVFPALTDVIAPLRIAVYALRDAFQAFRDGNYGEAFESIWNALKNVGAAILTALAMVDWYGIATAVAGWLGDQIALIPWGDYITGLGTFGADLQARFESAISTGVDWNGLGVKIGEKVAELAPIVGEKAVELVEEFARWIGDPSGWGQVALAFGAGLMLLPGSISGYIGGLMVQPAMDLLMGFVEGLDINWVLVAFWFSLMGPRVLTAIGSMIDTLTIKGIDLIMGLLTGAKNTWLGSVQPYLHERGAQAFASIGNLISTLVPKGTDLIAGFYAGAVDKWMTVRQWLVDRGPKSIDAVGSLLTTLMPKGKDLINGMYAGMISKWNEASSWLSGLPGRAINAVGSLGRVLYNAGASLIQGLIDGISSKIGALTSKLSEITGLIPDWKGPPERDAKLLYGNGLLIMQGLGRGLDSGWDDVARQLSGYTSAIGGEMGTGFDMSARNGANGGVHHHHYYSVTPEDLRMLIENANAGGSFARQFGGEVAMREGTV